MNSVLLAASFAAGVLAVAHTVIGEILIFKKIRQLRVENPEALNVLSRRRWAAIWSTWHLLTIFGFGIAAVLFQLAGHAGATYADLRWPLVATFGVGSLFWVIGTRGKHPAWIVLLLIAVLLWLA